MSLNRWANIQTGTDSTEQHDDNVSQTQQFATVGELLRYLRGERSLRQVQEDTGITYSYLSNIERGHKLPGEKVLTKLADYHNMPRGELLDLAGIDKSPNADLLFSNADIQRSFRFVMDDPSLVSYLKPTEDIPIEVQRFVVQIYERFTGKRLLAQETK